ncbi:hypothetical protein KQX54_001940 [Cotesia glomerata]|uniref:Uncharacterized protein n=1 Tax=Cotesia glomerata TaxID=32391 RepID=A0AAV7IMM2_COTGL|nr:hypothetical protein KQX54_001940 [Cotesia glomerata]
MDRRLLEVANIHRVNLVFQLQPNIPCPCLQYNTVRGQGQRDLMAWIAITEPVAPDGTSTWDLGYCAHDWC